MSYWWRKLDNTAKVFSLDEKRNNNTFRLSVILKEKIDPKVLEQATIQTLNTYPSYKVKIKTGFFWNYLEMNEKVPIIKKEKGIPCESIHFKENNDYLFKVTYFYNKINLDIFHVLTDGLGASKFFKELLYNYLDLKYHLKINSRIKTKVDPVQDENLKNVDKKLISNKYYKKAFFIKEKSNLLNNKTYHYILDLQKFKTICKKKNASITEYLTALYIYAIYQTVYDKKSSKDIIVSIPIDLRKYYNVESFSNFFTCMSVEGNVVNNKNNSFENILKQVQKEFKNKLTIENVKKYLSRDVKLGTNIAIRLVPLFIKKVFMQRFGKLVNQASTTTLSNIGSMEIDEPYKKYIDNIVVLVSTGKIQKVKCTICSYENNLNVTINSNLTSNHLENKFYELLKEHIGEIELKSNVV